MRPLPWRSKRPTRDRPRVRAVPAARALARSLGVDLGSLTGTGRAA